MTEKQTVTMKMAKASKQDIDAAVDLAGVLGNVDKGYYPAAPDSDDPDEPTFFDADDSEHLRAFYDRVKGCLDAAPGGLFRVVWGFHTLLRNDLVDPDLDHLELHPRIASALARKPVDPMSLAYPPEMTPALRHVLSLMCFQLASFAHVFRAAGADIKTRAEDEQAYCLHWLIKHVLLHGDAWKEHAQADLAAARAQIKGATQ